MVAPTVKAEPDSRSGGRGVRANPGRRGGSTGGGAAGDKERLNAIAYNNAYVEGRWGLFWHVGAMRLITCKASLAGVELPASPVDPNCKAWNLIPDSLDQVESQIDSNTIYYFEFQTWNLALQPA